MAGVSLYQTEVKSCGIDYITATAPRGESFGPFNELGRSLVAEAFRRGEKIHNYNTTGYRGLAGGGVCWAVRQDGAIIRASSEAASENWVRVFQVAQNVTRLDLQITIDGGVNARKLIETNWKEVKRVHRRRGRPFNFLMLNSQKGASGLNLGSRSSNQYMRIYHKGDESGLDCYQNCIRYELELKGPRAIQVATCINDSSERLKLICAYVARHAHERGCTLPVVADDVPGMGGHVLAEKRERKWQHIAICLDSFIEKSVDVDSRRIIRAICENALARLDVLERKSTNPNLPEFAEVHEWQN